MTVRDGLLTITFGACNEVRSYYKFVELFMIQLSTYSTVGLRF